MFRNLPCYLGLFLGIVFAGLISSCHNESKESFIENFGAFMADVDNGGKNYSLADWQAADEQFADFKDNQFSQWKNFMTPNEKSKVNEMIGRYQALQIKRGLKDLKDQVENTIDQSKTMFNELVKDTTLIK